MCIKGPGVAMRAPPGTKYRVFGLVVSHGASGGASTSASERRTVYVPNVYSDDESWGGMASTILTTDTTTIARLGDSVISLREYNRLLDMVMSLPLGSSPEERATVRGYTWGGTVSPHVRPHVWRLLCGSMPCAPTSSLRQQAELRRKREEYNNFVAEYYNITIAELTQTGSLRQDAKQRACTSTVAPISLDDRAILAQIALDLPRHTQALFHHPDTASALARCLFLWSQRYPAVGYVQGIDDIMAVFFFVFLEGAVNERNIQNKNEEKGNDRSGDASGLQALIPTAVVFTCDVQRFGSALEQFPKELLKAAEADAYVCGGFFLSWLQDNFVQGQPGIRRSMALVEGLLKKVDPSLLDSILSHGVALIDCCFQWVHCMLARELPMELLVLLWEKYLAMGNSEMVLDFHSYICAVLVMQLREKLLRQSVDVVIGRLKDPLGTRSKKKQGQQGTGDGSTCNRSWFEDLIQSASRLFREHPASSLA